MAACTDTFNFNQSKMFEKLRAGLPSDKTKTQNLLDCKDDLLFAWDSGDCCVQVINWRAAKVKGFDNIKYQVLVPNKPQSFEVEKILVSVECSLIALAGPRGLSIMEIPSRWGPNGYFMQGAEKIMCRSQNLDEELFVNNSHLKLLQIRWHPASPTDSHILALLSDNTIRVYNEATLRHVWRIGPLPCSLPPTVPSMPSLYSLGEVAVDFDIAPPRVVLSSGSNDVKDSRINNSTSIISVDDNNTTNTSIITSKSRGNILAETAERVEWPIVILRGNGNIYALCAGIDTDKPHLQGPLTIVPQTDDNYGVDSCSILVIPSLPPALIIAETTGTLHQALLLPTDEFEESFNEIDSSLNIYPSEWKVHVLETIELELGLPDNKNNTTTSHTCPIHLKRDFINELRYFAYHNTGLHVVTVNFIRELQHFVETEDTVNTLCFENSSNAEYLVCTKVEDKSKINAVLGFVLLQMPSAICLLLSSGQVISLNVIIDPKLFSDWSIPINTTNEKIKSLTNSPIQQIMGESFVTHIYNILKKDVNQPILSLDKSSELTPQETYELLSQAVQTLRENYFTKHEKARTEILKRVKILKLLREQQIKEIENLEKEKDVIRENAERLAEKYEDLYEKQQELSKKDQELMRQANICLPSNSFAEKEFLENVEKINEATKIMAKQLRQAQEKIKTQQLHIKKYTEQTENKKINLPPKQEETIKEILTQITKEIENQINDIKRIHAVLNI